MYYHREDRIHSLCVCVSSSDHVSVWIKDEIIEHVSFPSLVLYHRIYIPEIAYRYRPS